MPAIFHLPIIYVPPSASRKDWYKGESGLEALLAEHHVNFLDTCKLTRSNVFSISFLEAQMDYKNMLNTVSALHQSFPFFNKFPTKFPDPTKFSETVFVLEMVLLMHTNRATESANITQESTRKDLWDSLFKQRK